MNPSNTNDRQLERSFLKTKGYIRIMNELRELRNESNIEKYERVNLIFDDPTNLVLIVSTKNNNTIEFIFNEHYPFKPPIVMVNYINQEKKEIYYKTLYCKLTNITDTMIHYFIENRDESIFIPSHSTKAKKIACLCCSTVTCPANWSPVIMIKHILNEIEYNNQLKRDIKYKIAINTIIKQRNMTLELIPYIYEFLRIETKQSNHTE